MRFQLYDVVQLAAPIPERGLQVGAKGAVLLIYDEAEKPHYEVEFCDAKGATLGVVTLEEEALLPADE